MKRGVLWTLIGVFVIVLAAGLGLYFFRKPGFELVNPKMGAVEEAIYGLGTVKSNRVFEHKVGVITAIRKLYVAEGSSVIKGQKLVDLQEGIPLVAPFAGVITSLPFHENENIFPQTVIVRLEDLGDRFIEMALEQQGALRIRAGQSVRLAFESLRGSLFKGKIVSIYPSQGQFLVKIEPRDLPPEILPGMTSDVAVEVGRKENVLLIPMSAAMNGKITVERDGKRMKVAAQLGSSDGEWVEVLDGSIQLKDKIVIVRK